MHKGVGSLVFGNYLATYYGALKNNNVGEYNPDRIPEIEENPLINATAYNRIASLYDHLFKWVDSMNLAGGKKDVVEIVIIGVGSNTSSKRNWKGDVIRSTGFSPQVVEILAVLSELKNLKVNLTLIDKNEQSLDSAIDLEKYDVSLLLDNAACWEQDVSTRLLQCLRNIFPTEKLESKQLSASRNRLRHIKINTYCIDIREMAFPKMKADMIISTYVFQYLFKDDESLLAQNFLMQITQSLAPHGQLMMSDSYARFFIVHGI
jgi:SAM-dependent methyltransferase